MKKIIMIVALAVMVNGFQVPAAFALTADSPSITTSATIPSALTLTVLMKKNAFDGAVITSMNFGNLANIGNPPTNTLRSSPTGSTQTGAVWTAITVNSQGAAYSLTQTGTRMRNANQVALPDGACIVKAIYNAADNAQATQPLNSTTPSSGGVSWTAPGSPVLFSDPTGSLRTITAFYSITDDPAAGATSAVPLNQASGTYTGTVIFTVTTV